jgi:hypothetical protein
VDLACSPVGCCRLVASEHPFPQYDGGAVVRIWPTVTMCR